MPTIIQTRHIRHDPAPTNTAWPKVIVLTAIVFIFTLSTISTAWAQSSGGGETVPIGTGFDFNVTMQHVKDYVTDKLSYQVAGMLLQQVTTSVVNWINSGFDGSPAFVTNPQQFFLNVADQVTGAFIANTGILSGLCSPFSLDVRLSLALSQQTSANRQYSCTLNKVIQNTENALARGPNINVGYSQSGANLSDITSGNILKDGNQLSIQGASAEGFVNGDFTQGGWPAFIAMTSQPQNNPTGAYLTSRSDLELQIAQRQAAINSDLDRGKGFMSWQSCTDVATLNPDDPSGDFSNDVVSYENSGFKRKSNKDGTVTYQDCQTQTPGSVIAGSLEKSLGISQDRLNMADSINKIANALFSQLVSRVLTGGLHAASAGGGNTASIVSQLQDQSLVDQFNVAKKDLLNAVVDYESTTGIEEYMAARQESVRLISAVKSDFISAEVCYTNGKNTGQAAAVQSAIDTKVTPLENQYDQKLLSAQSDVSDSTDLKKNIQTATSLSQLQQYSQILNSLSPGRINVTAAEDDLASLKGILHDLTAEADRDLQQCLTGQRTGNTGINI